MVNTTNKQHVVRAGAMWVALAYIVDQDGDVITQAAVSTITRSITDPTGTVTADGLTVADTVYDTAQSVAGLWDETFNFKDDVPGAKIAVVGSHKVQYTLVMADSTTIKTDEFDAIGD
jgi:hypothetical protein